MSNIIWTYWEGTMPPYIEHCLMTLRKRSGCKVIVLSPTNISAVSGRVRLNPLVWGLRRPAQKADCIRVAVLRMLGGAWVDADTVCVNDMNEIFEDIDKHEFRCCIDPNINIPFNGYIVSSPHSKIMEAWSDKIDDELAKMYDPLFVQIKFHMFGCEMLKNLMKLPHKEMPMEWFFPFNFNNGNGRIFHGESTIKDYLTVGTKCIALSNSWLQGVRQDGCTGAVEDIAKERNLLGSIFKYSMELQ